MTTAVAQASGATATVRDLISLTKPRITFLVVTTTAGGLWLAPGAVPPARALLTLFATALIVGAANALNCWLERDVDRHMTRTANRPLPAGRMDPRWALALGAALTAISVPALTFGVNPLTGLLAAIALVSYVWVYTPMKQRSPKALIVGAVPGALPPLIGWTAATGSIAAPGLVLFGILFLWQLPHFIAISLFRKEEYTRAGIKVLPAVRGDQMAKVHAAAYSLVLLPVTLLLVPLKVAGDFYFVTATVLGVCFLGLSLYGLRADAGHTWARRSFFASLIYLTLLFFALIVDAA